MTKPVPRPGILDISPYQPGESKIAGKTRVIKLASNESPLGPSPAVRTAIEGGLDSLHLYPDAGASELREALGAAHNLDPARILCSNGSEEILHLLAKAYVGQGDEVIYSQYGFIAYPIAIKATGATPVVAPESDYRSDVDAILKAVTAKTKMVFLANPNNPTGTHLPHQEIERLHAALPEHVLLVLDEAYAEYASADDYRSALELAKGAENIIVSRTFSKIFGLAALRVGWSYCPTHVMDVLNRIRGTFNVNTLAQRAALAALADKDHTARARAHNSRALPEMARALEAMGVKTSPSQGNFLLAHFKDDTTARAADAHLRNDGIIVRPVAGYGLTHHLRITIGRDDENAALLESLAKFMETQKS